MKRVFLILFLALAAGALFAQTELTFLAEGDAYYKDWGPEGIKYADGFTTMNQKIVYNFQKANPGKVIHNLLIVS